MHTPDAPHPATRTAPTIPAAPNGHTGQTPWQLQYEPSLDGLRGLSIIAVVAYHACALSGVRLFEGGFVGVSVFFTLSGFLIANLLMRDRALHGSIRWGAFWARRIKRLAPAALVIVIAVTVVSATTDLLVVHRGDVVASIWSYTNWHVIIDGQSKLLGTIVGPLGPTWSLSVEEQFYLLAAAGSVIAMSRHWGRRSLYTMLAATWIASLLLEVFASPWSPRREFGTDVRLAEFAAGVALALWWSQPRRRVIRPLVADTLAFGGVAGIGALIFEGGHLQSRLLRGGYPLLGLLTAAAIAGLLSHHRAERMMRWQPLVLVGTLSYSLYLVHWPVLLVLNPGRAGFSGVRLVVLQIAISSAAAVALHFGVERPIRALTLPPPRAVIGCWLASSALISVAALLALS